MDFTETTKKSCLCSTLSILLIVIFIISPFSNFLILSLLMKSIIVLLLSYTIYLNNIQTTYLLNATQMNLSEQINSQLSINILCSYIFTFFIGLLIFYTMKSFFY